MTYVIFNGDAGKTIQLTGFNRNTTFDNGVMNSMAYLNVVNDANTASWLRDYGLNGINRLTIKDDQQNTLYNIDQLTAHISSINESLNGTEISVSVNIVF